MFKIRNTLCPFNVTRWNEEKSLFNCSSSTNVYHCLVDERNRSGEICIQSVWVQGGYCPEYNNDANTVDTVPCDWSVRCPSGPFQSYDVYQYPVCLNKTYNNFFVDGGGTSSLPWPIIGVVVGVLLVVLAVVVLLCYRKRRSQKSLNGKDEQIPFLAREIPFYKTSTFHKALRFLKDGGKILCLTGKWGSGRSTTAKEVYLSHTGRTPIVIMDILKFDVSTCKESVIVEESLPRDDISVEEKSHRVEKIIALCKQMQETKNTFLIITSTEEAWETISNEVRNCGVDEKEYRCIDLNWKNLTEGDRIQIFHTIFQFYNPEKPFSNVERILSKFNDNNVGFPELCTLFSKCSEFRYTKTGEISVVFFNRPLRNLSIYLEKMCQTSDTKEKFLLLVFMSLNNVRIDVKKSNNQLWQIFRSCGLNTGSVRLESIIAREFVVEEEPSVYALQHEIIKRMTLITFGKVYFSELLRFSSREDLKGWIKHKRRGFIVKEIIEDGKKQTSEVEPFLEIEDEQWIQYQEKMEMIF